MDNKLILNTSYNHMSDNNKKLHKFLSSNFTQEPLVCIDVGSAGGVKAPWMLVPYMRWVGIEPRENDTPVVIGKQEGKGLLYVTDNADSSSLLRPNSPFLSQLGVSYRYNIKDEVPVIITTLDQWLKQKQIYSIDFLKIDTQGTELSVLCGGEDSLKSVLGIDIEVNFAERYKGQAYFSEVDVFLRKKGFIIFDLQRRYFKRKIGISLGSPKGQLTHGTALYLRSDEYLRSCLLSIKDANERSIKVLKFASIALVYGYADYAAYISDAFHDILTPHHAKNLLELLKEYKHYTLPDFKGKYRLFHFLKKCSLFVKPIGKGGNTGDEDFGNA